MRTISLLGLFMYTRERGMSSWQAPMKRSMKAEGPAYLLRELSVGHHEGGDAARVEEVEKLVDLKRVKGAGGGGKGESTRRLKAERRSYTEQCVRNQGSRSKRASKRLVLMQHSCGSVESRAGMKIGVKNGVKVGRSCCARSSCLRR
eukprot:6200277-Pleurochrysis_carterae.AAC.3